MKKAKHINAPFIIPVYKVISYDDKKVEIYVYDFFERIEAALAFHTENTYISKISKDLLTEQDCKKSISNIRKNIDAIKKYCNENCGHYLYEIKAKEIIPAISDKMPTCAMFDWKSIPHHIAALMDLDYNIVRPEVSYLFPINLATNEVYDLTNKNELLYCSLSKEQTDAYFQLNTLTLNINLNFNFAKKGLFIPAGETDKKDNTEGKIIKVKTFEYIDALMRFIVEMKQLSPFAPIAQTFTDIINNARKIKNVKQEIFLIPDDYIYDIDGNIKGYYIKPSNITKYMAEIFGFEQKFGDIEKLYTNKNNSINLNQTEVVIICNEGDSLTNYILSYDEFDLFLTLKNLGENILLFSSMLNIVSNIR